MAAPRSLDDKTEKNIAKAYADGALVKNLASEHQVHTSTIRNAVIRHGVNLRPRGGIPGVPRSAYTGSEVNA